MYSSGSTGKPKGVIHLQSSIRYTIATYAWHVLQLTADDIAYSVPKLFFAYGFGNAMTFPFAVGASAVLDPDRPTPQRIFDTIERYRPTLLFAVPTLYISMINQPDAQSRDLSSLRACLSAAESLPPEIHARWLYTYSCAICEGCGSTEALHIYISNTTLHPRPGSADAEIPGYDIKLVDTNDDEHEINEPHEIGVMMVRGSSTTPAY